MLAMINTRIARPVAPSTGAGRNTLIKNWHCAVFPDVSIAVHETTVSPLGSVEPLGGVHSLLITEQLSDASGGG